MKELPTAYGSKAVGTLGPILDGLTDGVIVFEGGERLKAYNTRFAEMFGLAPGELEIGDDVETVMRVAAAHGGLAPGPSREAEVAERMRLWGTEADRRERRYLRSGRVIDVLRSETAEGDIVAVHVDVTDSVRRDRELEMQRQYLAATLENVADGVTMIDPEGRFFAFNRRFLELYRVDPERAYWGIPAGELARHFGDLDGLPEPERRAAEAERLRFATDPSMTRATRRLGDGRVLDLRKAVLAGGGAVVTIRDVTEELARERELEEARARAEESSRHKSQFLARMSHELRTPLNGVLGVAALLRTTDLDEHQRELVEVIVGSGDTLVRLIDDVLDLSRVEAGRLELRAERFELCGVMRESMALIEPYAARKGLEIVKDPSPVTPPPVIGDPVRVKQILLNLIGNAVKYTEEGSVTVGLRVTPEDDRCRCRIRVSDTGIGIPPAEQSAIFESFHQIEHPSAGRGDGAGLGLAVTRGLVEAIGGTIALESGRPGDTTFVVELDLPRAGETPAAG